MPTTDVTTNGNRQDSKPAVYITQRLPAAVMTRLERECDIELPAEGAPVGSAELGRHLSGKQGLICLLTDAIARDVIDGGKDLRVIANVAVGYDNIDVQYARARGIVVTNTPDVLTEAVAEFTWGLILATTRRIGEGDRLLRRGAWKGWALDFMLGSELRGKQLGVVGTGRIGRAVARRAPAFGMHVAFAGRDADGPVPDDAPPGSRRVSLDELLVTSDVVSLHVPFTSETRHLIDGRALARMKRSAYLVNTARGPVVDEVALARALGDGLIAGAALDVYEREPVVHPALLTLDNVVLAPHLGSATTETRTAMADLAVANVLAVLAGKSPITPVP